MARDNYNFDFDKTIRTCSSDFIRITKDIAHNVGIGYEDILDSISSDCETISLGQLVDIAEKVKASYLEEENTDNDSAIDNLLSSIIDSYEDKNELPF